MADNVIGTNPQDMYHPDEYEKQQQRPAPGLESKMNPVPDAGEDTYKGLGRLEGRRALITGGDSGIGRATAIAYAREGAKVAIGYHPSEEPDARSLYDLLTDEGREIILLPGDLAEESTAEKLIEQAVEKLGGLDLLVLNAGAQTAVAEISELSMKQVHHTFAVNVFAPILMAKTAIPHMPEGSCIILTSSSQYFKPSKDLLDYAASKFAVAGFGIALAKQVMDKGIRVNVVCPGPVWTALEVTGGQPAEEIPAFGQNTIFKRSAQPAEMAGVYVFLASDQATYISGEVYGLTGGSSH